MPNEAIIHRYKNGKFRNITCTCHNASYPTIKLFRKDHRILGESIMSIKRLAKLSNVPEATIKENVKRLEKLAHV
jgi:hypothetical protein